MIDATTYAAYSAIASKANTYWQEHATHSRSGWSSMPAALTAHPDYAACTNDIRGELEEYELHRDKPGSPLAITADGASLAATSIGMMPN